MARGAKPTLTLAHSNTGHRPTGRGRPPRMDSDLPKCPKQLSKRARKKWKEVVKWLADRELIAKVDEAVIAGYCQNYADWLDCLEFTSKNGSVLILRDDKGNVKWAQTDPHVSQARNHLEKVRQFAEMLGLSPEARTRLKLDNKKPQSRREMLLS